MRIGKNLVLFPLEAVLITLILQAAVPVLKRMTFTGLDTALLKLEKKHYILIGVLLLVSVGLILLYINGGADFIKNHNIKWL